MSKKNILITIAVFLFTFSVTAIIAYYSKNKPGMLTSDNLMQAACTGETRLCPNGTYVSRVGPNCEFERCPELKRFSGKGCYKKDSEGEDNFYELSNDFNSDGPEKIIKYANADFSVSFEIPFNPKWGNNECKVLPYLESRDPNGNLRVEFGKPRAWTTSEFVFHARQSRSGTDIINEQSETAGVPHPNPRKKIIGKFNLVVYESYGMGVSRIYEIIGKNNNYVFEYREFENIDKNRAEKLENVIASFNEDSLDNWKMYINKKHGFELQHPKNWELIENLDNNEFTIRRDEWSPELTIKFTDRKYSDVLTEEEKNFNEYQKDNASLEQPTGEIKKGVFANYATREFIYYSPVGFVQQTIIFPKNDQTVIIESYIGTDLDKILSTFKFTK